MKRSDYLLALAINIPVCSSLAALTVADLGEALLAANVLLTVGLILGAVNAKT